MVRVLSPTSLDRHNPESLAHPNLVKSHHRKLVQDSVPPTCTGVVERIPQTRPKFPKRTIPCRRVEVAAGDHQTIRRQNLQPPSDHPNLPAMTAPQGGLLSPILQGPHIKPEHRRRQTKTHNFNDASIVDVNSRVRSVESQPGIKWHGLYAAAENHRTIYAPDCASLSAEELASQRLHISSARLFLQQHDVWLIREHFFSRVHASCRAVEGDNTKALVARRGRKVVADWTKEERPWFLTENQAVSDKEENANNQHISWALLAAGDVQQYGPRQKVEPWWPHGQCGTGVGSGAEACRRGHAQCHGTPHPHRPRPLARTLSHTRVQTAPDSSGALVPIR